MKTLKVYSVEGFPFLINNNNEELLDIGVVPWVTYPFKEFNNELSNYFMFSDNGFLLNKETKEVKPYPYHGLTLYGPYKRKDGRKIVVCYSYNGQSDKAIRITVSYPKFLKECESGRKLEENETVDHKNRDYTDDRLSNLIILPKGLHSSLDALRVAYDDCVCPMCGTTFQPTKAQRENRTIPKAGPFCSRKCSGLYGAKVQNKQCKPMSRITLKKKHYRIEKI